MSHLVTRASSSILARSLKNSVGSNLWRERDFEYEQEEDESEDDSAEVADEEDDEDNETAASEKEEASESDPGACPELHQSGVDIKAVAACKEDARPLPWLGLARENKKPPSFARLGGRGRLPLRGRENGRSATNLFPFRLRKD